MFNKLKQFRDLRSQAKTLQDSLSQESVTVDKNGTKLTMNGNMEITLLTLNGELAKETQEKILTELFNDAVKKIQRVMAKKMQEMGGFPGLN
jgi:DNA-binding protein YbaB